MENSPSGSSNSPVDRLIANHDTRITADRSQLYRVFERRFAYQVGRSSVAAGWSQDVVVERWSVPPIEGIEIVMSRHRFVVCLNSAPMSSTFRDDGRARDFNLMPGTVHTIPLGMTSQPRTTSRFETASFEFSSALFERVLDGLAPAPSEQVISCRNVPDQRAHDLNRRILAELAMPSEPLYGEMLCLAMAVHVLRQYGRTRVHALRFKGRLSPIQAGRVLDYMHANLDRRLSISALAHEAGLSDAHFARAFHATFKEPPHRVVLRWRLQRAARLVAKKGYSLAEAAVAAGFCDQAHLTNAMRRHFGRTPGVLIERPKSLI